MLSDHTIWLIDDDIPLFKLAADFPARDEILSGKRPIDHGLLSHLLSIAQEDDWRDKNVYELCKQLTQSVKTIVAFQYPDNAMNYLEQGAPLPDIVVYDLEYRVRPQLVDEQLCKILESCFTLVQVYSTDNAGTAKTKLPIAFKRYSPKRLSEPQRKSECDATVLSKLLDDQLARSFSAKVTKVIRKSSVAAIEKTLIGLDDLTLVEAVKALLGHIDQTDRLGEQDLVDLIGNKVADTLANDENLRRKLQEYATGILGGVKLPEEQLDQATRSLTALITATVKERIQNNRDLFDLIESVGKVAKAKLGAGQAQPQPADTPALTRFTNYWMYAHPKDEIVRTGDIIQITDGSKSAAPPTLYLVLTPPCDIEQFWKKTRGCLTLAVLEPIQDGPAVQFLNQHSKKKSQFEKRNLKKLNPGSDGPVLLPAINLDDKSYTDYVLFSHRIESRVLQNADENDWTHMPTYSVLTKAVLPLKINRIARLSEPFLTGVLEHIASTIFQTGLPYIPETETTRVNELLKG